MTRALGRHSLGVCSPLWWLSLAAACFLLAALCLAPSKAFAWFNDVAKGYPASQSVSASGEVLTGADVPEGEYGITVSTSSSMCNLSNVKLTSAGGQLYATFTMTGAYDALFFGTAEEAAASTNEDGTDISNYYVGNDMGKRVTHHYSLPIPALNSPITLATYSGGSSGTAKGCWYTRTVVFNSGSNVDSAVAAARAGGSGSGKTSGGEGEASGGSGQSDQASEDGASQQDSGSSKSSSGSAKTGSKSGKNKNKNKNRNRKKSGATSGSGSSGSQTDGGQTDQGAGQSNAADDSADPAKDEEPAAESSDAAEKADKPDKAEENAVFGIPLSLVGLDELFQLDADTPDAAAQDRQVPALTGTIVAACVVGLVDVALIALLVCGVRRVRTRAVAGEGADSAGAQDAQEGN